MIRLRSILFSCCLLGCTAAYAQSGAAPGDNVEESASARQSAADDLESESTQVDQAAQDSSKVQDAAATTEKVEPEPERAQKSKRSEADQVFVPSEEISEDVPVPFPIDI